MKNLLKIFLISSSLYACNNSIGDKNSGEEISYEDSTIDNHVDEDDGGFEYTQDSEDPEKEKAEQVRLALFSSKKEIEQLQTELSDSISKSGLNPERKLLFKKTIKQLESTHDLVNKQLEQIFVTDLMSSQNKLNVIVKEMKGSGKKLDGMIARLDKITDLMQGAVVLLQSIKP